MRIDVVTIFPDYLQPLALSLIGKARAAGLLDLAVHDLRDFTHDRHRTVDDTPYGGGAGMVMRPEPWGEALDTVVATGPHEGASVPRLLVPSPGGVPFHQALAHELAGEPWLAFACGRYEGIDERVLDHAADRMAVTPVSLGDYVLNGGEVAVLAITEAVVRLLPGVVGNAESLVEESHEGGLLEYPVYTKPPSWRGLSVPEVLLSGDHARIEQWRGRQRLERTAQRRPDLLGHAGVIPDGGLDQLELRLAVPADAAELHVLTRCCWVQEIRSIGAWDIPTITEEYADTQASLRPGSPWRTWVLRSAGRLVGSVRGRPAVGPDGDQRWHLGRLMVAPDLQGTGLGRALLEFGIAQAPTGTRAIELVAGATSHDNQRMYRKAGFRLAGRWPEDDRAVRMVRPVRPVR